jgi:hypothetical protein
LVLRNFLWQLFLLIKVIIFCSWELYVTIVSINKSSFYLFIYFLSCSSSSSPCLQWTWVSRLFGFGIVGVLGLLDESNDLIPIKPSLEPKFYVNLFSNLFHCFSNEITSINRRTERWSLIVVISSSQISSEGSKDEVWYWNKWN